ncbi:hypothetical protein D3C71_1798510 [compost metagenome]
MQLVGGDNLHVGQQIGRIFFRVSNARLHFAAGHADLVDQLAVLGYEGVTRQAAQYINGSAFNVVRLWRIAKKRPHVWVGQAAAGVVLVECPL